MKCARIHGKKTTIEMLAGKTTKSTTTIIMNLFTFKNFNEASVRDMKTKIVFFQTWK